MGGQRYKNSDKERAFRIFYDTGSLSEVVRRMRASLPRLAKATVAKWAKEADSRGRDWYARRNEIQAAAHDNLDEQLAADRRDILKTAAQFKERLVNQLPAIEAKTLEGATFAFTALSKFILEQSGADRDSEQTAKEAVSALILALKDDPEIAEMLEKKWSEIETRFYAHLERVQKKEKKKK